MTWDLTLSVPVGTLTLSTTAGLAGSGDGTGSLSYSGPPSALNAALAGMRYTPPAGYLGNLTISLDAQSDGAAPVQAQVPIIVISGRFEVTTTADSGPGSLRQAILDSNNNTGGTNTIDFAIPGTGVRTIAPASPLPAITNPVVIDGTTQPGYAGAPLIAIISQGTGDADPLTVGSDVTVKGLAIGGAGFSSVNSSPMLTVESVPLSQAQGGIVTYQIVVTAGEDLVATAQAVGTTTSLSLLDAQGHVVVQSDGLSAAGPIDAIDTYIEPGTYSLQVHDINGNGSFTLTAEMMPSSAPYRPIPVGSTPVAIVAGDFNGDGKRDLAVASSDGVSILLGNGDGTFQPAIDYAVGADPVAIVAGDFNGDGELDLAVADDSDGTVLVLLNNGDGTFQLAGNYAVGSSDGSILEPDAIVAGDFSGDGRTDLAVADSGSFPDGRVSVLLGNGDGTFQSAVQYAVGSAPDAIVAGDFSGNGRTDLAIADVVSDEISVLLGNGNGTFRARGAVRGGDGSGEHCGGRLQWRRPHRPGRGGSGE